MGYQFPTQDHFSHTTAQFNEKLWKRIPKAATLIPASHPSRRCCGTQIMTWTYDNTMLTTTTVRLPPTWWRGVDSGDITVECSTTKALRVPPDRKPGKKRIISKKYTLLSDGVFQFLWGRWIQTIAHVRHCNLGDRRGSKWGGVGNWWQTTQRHEVNKSLKRLLGYLDAFLRGCLRIYFDRFRLWFDRVAAMVHGWLD